MRRDPCHRECLHWTGGRTASSCYPTVRGYLLLPGMRFSYGVSIPKVRREAEECASTFDFQGDALIATLCSWHRNSGGWSAIRGSNPSVFAGLVPASRHTGCDLQAKRAVNEY